MNIFVRLTMIEQHPEFIEYLGKIYDKAKLAEGDARLFRLRYAKHS